ncbi:MAG: hypothetical protein K2K68_04935, partial [Duncaniella sp.]|nr:hypothetical protein [Duncaniella sp.]
VWRWEVDSSMRVMWPVGATSAIAALKRNLNHISLGDFHNCNKYYNLISVFVKIVYPPLQ